MAVWKTAEKKIIGTVLLVEEGVTPRPVTPTPKPPVPVPIIQSFIDEHKKLKAILDSYGAKGACVPRTTLEKEGGIVGEQLDRHIRVFTNSDAAAPITEEGEEVLCSKNAIRELKKKLEVEL